MRTQAGAGPAEKEPREGEKGRRTAGRRRRPGTVANTGRATRKEELRKGGGQVGARGQSEQQLQYLGW